MLSAQLMKQLSDAELVRMASNETNDITSTALELELLSRLENATEALAAAEEHEALGDIAAEFSLTSKDMRDLLESHCGTTEEMAKLLALLNDEDIHTLVQLQALLDFHNTFKALANDAGDAFARLSTLVTTAQE